MNSSKYFIQRSKGFSLAELMIALSIGLVVTAAAGGLFTFGSKAFSVQQEQSRMQESGRMALDLIAKTIRNTSNFGCRSDWTVTQIKGFNNFLNPSPGYAYDFGATPLDKQLLGYKGVGTNWSPAIPADLLVPATADKNSDIITVRGATGNPALVVAPYAATDTDAINVNTSNGFSASDALVISDCAMSTIFQVSGNPNSDGVLSHPTASGTPGNSTPSLGKVYGSGAEVYKLATTTFFIAPSQFSANPSLWRIVGTGAAEELAENVERIKVYYGTDPTLGIDLSKKDFAPTAFSSANSAGLDMSKVVSVTIKLLVRSPSDFVTTAKQTYTFDSTTSTTATDNRLRSVFSETISLRNRVL